MVARSARHGMVGTSTLLAAQLKLLSRLPVFDVEDDRNALFSKAVLVM